MRLALTAFVALVAAQTIFWAWTQPANVATANWTIAPDNWQEMRRQWELSHAAGAAFQVVAFCALILAALARRRR